MSVNIRRLHLLKLTKKLVICTFLLLVVILIFFFSFYQNNSNYRSYLTLIVFATGLVGGFVSIQQRIHKVSDEELIYLAESWPSVLLIPIYGGIFALILHVAFLSEIVKGSMFPNYYVPAYQSPPRLEDLKDFFMSILPLTGQDTAKMIFWAFCSGFSERLVPQIIQKINNEGIKESEIKSTQTDTDTD